MDVVNLNETVDRAVWARAAKAATLIYCGVLPAIVVGMEVVAALRLGSDSTGTIFRFALVGASMFLLPVALYAALIRTNAAVAVVGGGLVALQTSSIWVMVTSGSSTAGLALLWIPFLGVPFVLLGWAFDVWVRAMRPLSPPA